MATDVHTTATEHATWYSEQIKQTYVTAFEHGHKHGYKDGFEAGREAALREVAEKVKQTAKARDEATLRMIDATKGQK